MKKQWTLFPINKDKIKHLREESIPEESRIFGGERIFMPLGELTITNGKDHTWYQYLGDPEDITHNDISFMLSTPPQEMPKILTDLAKLIQWRRLNDIDKQ